MGKRIFIGLLLLTVGSLTHAQTVSIPDANFRSRLKRAYASVLDANDNLIVLRAATITGRFTCNNCGIRSLEGLQYFTRLREINVPENAITFLPDLSNISNLEILTINDNLLDSLPDLSKLRRLKIINAHRNRLRRLPNLSENDSLQVLYVHSNQLDTLPYMGNLKQMGFLHLFNNKLTSVPGLEKMTALSTLYLSSNRLKSLPDLSALTNLKEIFAQNNAIEAMPSFAPGNRLSIIRFENNSLTKLPDLLGLTSVTTFRVQGNKLTFKELGKIKSLPNYLNMALYGGQAQVQVGQAYQAREKTSFALKAKVDDSAPNTTYEWYKDGLSLGTVAGDSYTIDTVKFTNAGKYNCVLRNSDFPQLTLYTDTFTLIVSPCFDPTAVVWYVTPMDCNTEGKVIIFPTTTLPSGTTYILTASISGRVYTSTNGKFENLQEPLYTLQLRATTGCTATSPKVVSVPTSVCSEALLTPDGDGNNDTYFFNTTGPIRIYDKRGQKIKELQGPAEWDCTSEKGKVAIGYYMADINQGESKIGLSVVY